MSLKDKLKNVFLVETEETDDQAVAPQSVPAKTAKTDTPGGGVLFQPVAASLSGVAGEVNQKMVDELCTVLDEQNLPGPDYIEVRNAANALKEVLADDNQALKTAYITIRTTHPDFNKDIVLKSIDSYVKIIENERQQGKKSLATKRDKEIRTREETIAKAIEAIAAWQKEIEEKEKQINTLRTQIAKNNENITALRGEISNAEVLIQKQDLDFNASVDFMLLKLNNDKQNLNNIL
jgi:hypothetical protein